MNRSCRAVGLCLVLLFGAGYGYASAAGPVSRFTGPWNLERLQQPPKAEWSEVVGAVQEVYYEGEPYQGKPTRVFAYFARPKEAKEPVPGVVLVHGGGGTAFAEWATLWAERGYAAIAMDLAGCGPNREPLPDGGPPQSGEAKFPSSFDDDQIDTVWSYHAVAAVIRGHSLLASCEGVDPERIGITGISWGGYLTCIVAGLDDRLKVAVPVYGCGFLEENSAWLAQFERMSPELRQRWVRNFDPSQYLPGVDCPILFMNGTNDFAYPLDSYQKSYQLIRSPRWLSIRSPMPHSHPAGWALVEIGLHFDSVLRGAVPLPQIGELTIDGSTAAARFSSSSKVVEGHLHYTTDEGPWNKRTWATVAATLDGDHVRAEIPTQRPLVCYLSITDDRGALVSTPHIVLTPASTENNAVNP